MIKADDPYALSASDRAILKHLPDYLRNTLIQYRQSMMEIDPRPLSVGTIVEAALRVFWSQPGQQTAPDIEALQTLRRYGR